MADQDGSDTHQLLKACRQCPLLAAARLNVLRKHMGDGACHVGKTFCALPSHKLAGSSEPTCLASVLRVPYVRVSPLSSVTEEVPSIRGVCTSSLSAVRSVPSCSVTAFSTGSCLSSACVASPAQRERGTEKIETHVNVHGERRTAPPPPPPCAGVMRFPHLNSTCRRSFGFSCEQAASRPRPALGQPATGPVTGVE